MHLQSTYLLIQAENQESIKISYNNYIIYQNVLKSSDLNSPLWFSSVKATYVQAELILLFQSNKLARPDGRCCAQYSPTSLKIMFCWQITLPGYHKEICNYQIKVLCVIYLTLHHGWQLNMFKAVTSGWIPKSAGVPPTLLSPLPLSGEISPVETCWWFLVLVFVCDVINHSTMQL